MWRARPQEKRVMCVYWKRGHIGKFYFRVLVNSWVWVATMKYLTQLTYKGKKKGLFKLQHRH